MNIFVMKLDADVVFTHLRPKQDYGDLETLSRKLLEQYHEGKTLQGFALVSLQTYDAVFGADSELTKTIDIVQKKDTAKSKKAIPPHGVALGSMADTDMVLSY